MPKMLLFDFSAIPAPNMRSLQFALQSKGIDADVIDFSKEARKAYLFGEESKNTYGIVSIDKGISACKKKMLRLKEKIASADYFGISFLNYGHDIKLKIPLARFLKEQFPGKVLIGGGVGLNSQPKDFFREARLDFALRGEAEKTLPGLITALENNVGFEGLKAIDGIMFKLGGRYFIARNKGRLAQQELSEFPLAAGILGKTAFVVSERGCPFACIFCSCPSKGSVRFMSQERVIEGLKALALEEKVRKVSFSNDQFLTDRSRTLGLLEAIVKEGLHKRFSFALLGSVDIFYTNGIIDQGLIRLLKKANFRAVSVGVESFNDAILKEIKGGRYSAVQALRLERELSRHGFKVKAFLIAAGIETKPKQFIESYYRAVAERIRRGKGSIPIIALLRATQDAGIFARAVAAGTLYNEKGRRISKSEERKSLADSFAMPKDEALRKLFFSKLKTHSFTVRDIPLVQAFAGNFSQFYAKRLQKLKGMHKAQYDERKEIAFNFLIQELKKRGITVDSLSGEQRRRIFDLAYEKANSFIKARQEIPKLAGIRRLQALQKIRKRFGISGFFGGTFKRRLLP